MTRFAVLPWLVVAVAVTGCSTSAEGGDGMGGSGGGFGVSAGTGSGPSDARGNGAEAEPTGDCEGADTGFEATPRRATSTASATYALGAVRSGRLPEPAAIRVDELWNAFGPTAGRDAAAAVVRATPRGLGEDTRVTFDARYLPSAGDLGDRPPVHLVVAADVGESMARELQIEADVLRALGGVLDVEGDRLSVILWGAPEVVLFELVEPSARAEAAAATVEALVGEQLVPSAGFDRVADWIDEVLAEPGPAHVLLLTDGSSPVEPARVALLAARAPVTIAQLAALDPAPAAGEAPPAVPFAGGMLRSVATAGDGAALWIGADEGGADLTSFTLSFDATFRRSAIAQGLGVQPPGWLRLEASGGGMDGAGSLALPTLGHGEAVHVQAPAVLCAAEDLVVPVDVVLTSPRGGETVTTVGPPARPGQDFLPTDPLVAHDLAVEEAATILSKACHDPLLRAAFDLHVELAGSRDAGRVAHLVELVAGHAELAPACEVGP